MDDPNEPLTKKQKDAIKAAKLADIDRKSQKKIGFKPKSKSYKKGGKVRGCGIARKGLTKGTMR